MSVFGGMSRSDFVRKPKPMKTFLKAFAITLILSQLFSQIGCATASSNAKPVLNIYQPDILRLKAGTSVQTLDGTYTAQTEEVWHSDKRYRELEYKLLHP